MDNLGKLFLSCIFYIFLLLAFVTFMPRVDDSGFFDGQGIDG
jgi:hypothetical protein